MIGGDMEDASWNEAFILLSVMYVTSVPLSEWRIEVGLEGAEQFDNNLQSYEKYIIQKKVNATSLVIHTYYKL